MARRAAIRGLARFRMETWVFTCCSPYAAEVGQGCSGGQAASVARIGPIRLPSAKRISSARIQGPMKTKSELLKDARSQVAELTPAELSKLPQKPVLLDVREKDE